MSSVMDLRHMMMYPGAADCKGRHCRYVWPAEQFEEALILSDSILRKVRYLRRTKVYAVPGADLDRLAQEIRRGKVDVSFQRAILVHAGTNNLQANSPQEIRRKTEILVDTIRARNATAKIMISGILVRPRDEVNGGMYTRRGHITLALRRQANLLVQRMIQARGDIYLKSWKCVMVNQGPNHLYYHTDGLHLSDRGVYRIQQYLVNCLGRACPQNN
jgi:hypothetical protein